MGRRPRLRFLLVPLAASLVLASCGTEETDTRSETAGLPSLQQLLEVHEWVLARTGSAPAIEGGTRPTIRFSDDVVSGSGPCNAFRGDVSVGEGSIDISRLASTQRACDEPATAAEALYVSGLEAVDHADVDHDDDTRLVLTGPEVRLAFRSYDADELLVGSWEVVNVATGSALESVVDGTTPTLTFDDDGTLVLAGGCNTGRTSWELDGTLISFDPVAQTNTACPEPEGVMDQDTALAAALDAAVRVEITPDSLTLLDDGGSIVLLAVRT